jgi:hypothetical protein
MLTLEIASVPEQQKHVLQQEYLEQMVKAAGNWQQGMGQAYPARASVCAPLSVTC